MAKKIVEIDPAPGIRLRELRDKAKATRSSFNKRTGISASTLRRIEVGELALSEGRALTLSLMFTLVYKLDEDKASQHMLLYGHNDKSVKSKILPL